MKPASIEQSGLGRKAVEIMTWALIPTEDITSRHEGFQQLCYEFSKKSVLRKVEELAQRGYLENLDTNSPLLSWSLTHKGATTLERIMTSG